MSAVLATHVTKQRVTKFKVGGAPWKAVVSVCDKAIRRENECFESKE